MDSEASAQLVLSSAIHTGVGVGVGGLAALALFRGGRLGNLGRMGLAGFGGGMGAGTVASYYYPDSSYFKLDPPKIKLRSEEIVGNIWERTIDKGVVSTAVGFGVGGAAALVLFRGGMGRAAIMGFGGGWGAGNIWAQASKEFEALEKKLPTK